MQLQLESQENKQRNGQQASASKEEHRSEYTYEDVEGED